MTEQPEQKQEIEVTLPRDIAEMMKNLLEDKSNSLQGDEDSLLNYARGLRGSAAYRIEGARNAIEQEAKNSETKAAEVQALRFRLDNVAFEIEEALKPPAPPRPAQTVGRVSRRTNFGI